MNLSKLDGLLSKLDKVVVSQNALGGALFGGMIGLSSTIFIIAVFTLISVNEFMNFYVGGFFIVIGTMLLYRVHKRRGMISTDLRNNGSLRAEQDEEESLLRESEAPTYKGGIGAEILHLPMQYTDSHISNASLNEAMNYSIKQIEYAMSVSKILSGILCLTLEKENF